MHVPNSPICRNGIEHKACNRLAFDYLDANSTSSEPAVRTGHAGGIITLDIREADDAYRHKIVSVTS